jgi:uncharacterized protein YigE (DUF2233 family)
MRAACLSAVLLAAPVSAASTDCREIDFESTGFTACRIDPATEDLRLWLRDGDGQILGTFDRVNAQLAPEGLTIGVAMNAGMYHPDRRPVGLYIEEGVEAAPLVTRAGPGNFGLLPNGVLCLGDGTAAVIESRRFAENPPPCRHATQSGPMLVIGGDLHPRFIEGSDFVNIRNGVGVDSEGALWMAIANAPVNFHRFARLFRDVLGTPDALYLDGRVSRLYLGPQGRHDRGLPLGPILGTAIPAD